MKIKIDKLENKIKINGNKEMTYSYFSFTGTHLIVGINGNKTEVDLGEEYEIYKDDILWKNKQKKIGIKQIKK